MGCTQSKIENEEAVIRCKDRKQFMKHAVASRNAFAAAHSSYAMYLKDTGAALSDYAQGEVLNPTQLSHTALSGAAGGTLDVGSSQQSFVEPLPPPPPPMETLSGFSASLLPRAASMPEINLPQKLKQSEMTVTIEEEEEDGEIESNERLVTRKSWNYKSGGSGSSRESRREAVEEQKAVPPVVEMSSVQAHSQHQSTWGDYFFPDVDSMPRPSLADVEEGRVEKGELEREVFEEMTKRRKEVVEEEEKREEVVVEQKAAAVEMDKMMEKAVAETAKGMRKAGPSAGEKRVAKGSTNLLKIFEDLDDHFLKASESAHEVSKMLEATRLHYHSNFADNRGHIDHSAIVMRVISWNRSFRGLGDEDDGNNDFDSEENETHATILDKLLAWEKKLYDEVKAGELMKFEYQRKVTTLNKLKKRGANSEALEKAKAALSHLHTRYIVDMQSLDSTVSEINRLRDEQLYPKLVQLVDGMTTMWKTMKVHHDRQAKTVTDLRYLDPSESSKETSEHHHDRTNLLWGVVKEWHSQFCKLVDNQKDYIKALNDWLKLNLIPIESNLREKVSSPPRVQRPPIQNLLLAWHDHLNKLEDGVARTTISSFAAVVNDIKHHQEEEIKQKRKCEETRKELNRKTQQFEDWYNKYVQRRAPEELDPERTEDNTHTDAVAERQLAVEAVKKTLEEEEEAYQRICIQVRQKSLASLRTRLPELSWAMSNTALAFSHMYSDLRSISDHRSPSQSSV
ncbi:hypothetical protein SLEP1_g21571 [Rubroshorea leprosula]|uniref:Nitrate regulatory gene2 protein-like n=1 Tax=Rubroshorea leprosula TaxID=152421 RepID=A0AAV5JGX4_9ROSI|nr:hypothetical protein SLEP1_g21571 [Rubroshorea leprosula]